MLKEFLFEYLPKEFGTIKAAPLFFVITAVIFFSLGIAAAIWKYEGTIKEYDKALVTKDDIIRDRDQRLRLIQRSDNPYSLMTNEELRKETLTICNGIRKLLFWYYKEENKIRTAKNQQKVKASTEEEQQSIRESFRKQEDELFLKLKTEYDRNFCTEVVNLWGEIYLRLPSELQERIEYSRNFQIQYPTNMLGMEWVANYLEVNVKQLTQSLGTGFSAYSDKELEEKARSMAEKINALLENESKAQQNLNTSKIAEINKAKSNIEKEQINLKYEALSSIESLKTKYEFYRKLEIDSFLITKEIKIRLSFRNLNMKPLSVLYEDHKAHHREGIMNRRETLLQLADEISLKNS